MLFIRGEEMGGQKINDEWLGRGINNPSSGLKSTADDPGIPEHRTAQSIALRPELSLVKCGGTASLKQCVENKNQQTAAYSCVILSMRLM
jgi:hypothetical protein